MRAGIEWKSRIKMLHKNSTLSLYNITIKFFRKTIDKYPIL